MCKHVAATLYGVGARLDHDPELLFTLRGADPAEMVADAVARPPPGGKSRRGKGLKSDELSSVFGIDIDMGERATAVKKRAVKKRAAKKSSVKKKPANKKANTKKKGATTRKAAAKRASGRATRQAT